jgi:hypothetical protein
MSTVPDQPPPPSGGPSRRRIALAAGGGTLVVAVAAIALLRSPPTPTNATPGVAPMSPNGGVLIPAYSTKEHLDVSSVDAPSTWIDVAAPAAVRSVLTENAWLKSVSSTPLGKGFLGSWGAFFGSANDDLGLSAVGKGLVGDIVVDRLFSQPLRVTFFGGTSAEAPALVVPKPDATLTSAVEALTMTLQRGGYTFDACPGEQPVMVDPPPPPADAGPSDVDAGTPSTEKVPAGIPIVRWIVADHTLYVATARDRFVASRDVESVVNALCAPLPTIAVEAGHDVVVGASPEQLGREMQALTALLGVGNDVRLVFSVDGTRLKPLGLAGSLTHPERLAEGAISKDTWKLVPEDLPVVVGAHLNLPVPLNTQTLQQLWSKGEAGLQLKARDVLVLWQPHGDDHATEVAVVWSDISDREALQAIFSGPNAMPVTEACGRLVASSSAALTARVLGACGGAAPSLLFAQPAVVDGLSKEWSVGAVIDSSRLLQTLLLEGWADDVRAAGGQEKKAKGPPPEIEAARQQLGELPRFGVVGTRTKAALRAWGFSS